MHKNTNTDFFFFFNFTFSISFKTYINNGVTSQFLKYPVFKCSNTNLNMLKILNTFAQFNKQLWVLFLLRCVKIHPMKLLFNQNDFVAEFVFRQTVFASVKNLFYILISFFFF